MNKVYFEKKAYHLITLKYLAEFKCVLKKAQHFPQYWVKRQNRNIKKFVKYIYKIPFYRERFDICGITPKDIVTAEDFMKLPVLTKEQYRDWTNEEVIQHPSRYKFHNTRTTSGTSGMPLKMYRLPRDVASDIANLFRSVYLQDVGYHTFTDKIFSMMIPESAKDSFIQKIGILRRKQVSASNPTEVLIEEYNKYKPQFFYGNKSAMQLMASYAVENHIVMHKPKCIATISEKIDDNARNIIKKAFGIEPYDMYGTSEVGNFACEKSGEREIHHIWNDTHVVNVVDDNGNCVENGVGQIYVTSLYHKGFPLVNYCLGDIVEVKTVSGEKIITKIYGRSDDKIINADGSSYSWIHVCKTVSGIVELMQYRVIQNDYDSLNFCLVTDSDDFEVKKAIEEKITQRANELFKTNPKNLIFEWMDKIPPESNGKVRMLISNVKR